MAALFQTWPKKWLFYLIIGHVVIQNNNNNNNKRKKRRQLVLVASPVFCFFCFFWFFFIIIIIIIFFYVKMHEVEKLDGDNCVQYALTLQGQKKLKKMSELKHNVLLLLLFQRNKLHCYVPNSNCYVWLLIVTSYHQHKFLLLQ